MIEKLTESRNIKVESALFDFDGTISTLRCGWEKVMAPMMVEYIMECGKDDENDVKQLVDAWIDESTGIQTIFQMKWLAEQVAARGGNVLDPWDYKAEYNRRLMLDIDQKKARLNSGEEQPENYLMAGSVEFLKALKANGVAIYVASGTDHPDVVTEAKALGVYGLFDEIAGAPLHEEKLLQGSGAQAPYIRSRSQGQSGGRGGRRQGGDNAGPRGGRIRHRPRQRRGQSSGRERSKARKANKGRCGHHHRRFS